MITNVTIDNFLSTATRTLRNVFGAPSWKLPDGEIFWGQDRIDLLRWRLGA
ncbi:hypothetical protein [Thalassobaculum sp.]|uniref:hypothetical protein n=1 Tax=Thalassobaculum sp. TaxID=2022740 RepID=UPI0032EFF677